MVGLQNITAFVTVLAQPSCICSHHIFVMPFFHHITCFSSSGSEAGSLIAPSDPIQPHPVWPHLIPPPHLTPTPRPNPLHPTNYPLHFDSAQPVAWHCNLTAQPDCSGLQAWMLFSQLAQAGQLSRQRRGEAVYPYVLLCPFVLSAAVSFALTALVGWHAYLIWHAQVIL